jgi:KipI family sensor histidine kinase inhibitor
MTPSIITSGLGGQSNDRREWPRLLPCGDSAFTVEFGDVIDPALTDRVLALDAALAASDLPVVDTTPTYRALLVEYDPQVAGFKKMRAAILELLSDPPPLAARGRLWEVPVVYGGQFGEDLQGLADSRGISGEELITRHLTPEYHVCMIGFTPGFTYLAGLEPSLSTPRRDTPRLKAPAGAIAIGGAQTAISGIEAPSGWHQIGRTPVRTFMAERDPPCLLQPGDRVRFRRIGEVAWHALALDAYLDKPVAKIIA